MKYLSNRILFAFFLISCSYEKKQFPIEGTWRYNDANKGCEINMKNGLYNSIRWSDDLIICSNGKYFINENPSRKCITLTLIPDLEINEDDTLILDCKNIDIVSITDSVLVTRVPILLPYEKKSGTNWKNQIEERYRRKKD